jgi:hypothetical protein
MCWFSGAWDRTSIVAEDNVGRAGLEVERMQALAPLDLVKLVVAEPAGGANG